MARAKTNQGFNTGLNAVSRNSCHNLVHLRLAGPDIQTEYRLDGHCQSETTGEGLCVHRRRLHQVSDGQMKANAA